MELNKWAFNFDLFQDKLIEEGFENPLKAYYELGHELKNFGYNKRQQSSYFGTFPEKDSEIYLDMMIISEKLPWLKRCVNHFTATAESAVLDLNPYFYEEQTKQDFINFENERGVTREQRAIHFDLTTKKVDMYFKYRSQPYYQIKKEAKKLGYEWQQGSGYASKQAKSAEEFADDIYEIMDRIPNLKYVIGQVDATYLKDVYDVTPFIKDEVEQDENTHQVNLESHPNKILTSKELISKTLGIISGTVAKEELQNCTFEYKEKQFQILDIEKEKGKHQAEAIIKDCETQECFLEKNFAGSNPFKLALNQPVKTSDLKAIKNSKLIMN